MAAPRNENIKTIILDAAEELLQKKTLSEMSLAQIAECAGILVKYVIERNVEASRMRVHLLDAAISGNDALRKKMVQRYREFQSLIAQKIAERTDKVSADYITWLILTSSDGMIVQKVLQNESFDVDAFILQTAEIMKRLESD